MESEEKYPSGQKIQKLQYKSSMPFESHIRYNLLNTDNIQMYLERQYKWHDGEALKQGKDDRENYQIH